LIWGEKPFTAACDGQMALDADELQYAHGYGPCVDADRAGQVFLVEDMQSDQRWPNYAQSIAAHGVRAVTVPRRDHRGLNTYARRPQAFSRHDVDLAEEVTAWIAVTMLIWPRR
jgi:hypothetical protein